MNVWVTRDETHNGPLCTALRGAGLDVTLVPVVHRSIVNNCEDVLRDLGADDWLVLTSVFAVEAVLVKHARVPRVAVVGEASRKAAEARGMRVEMISAGRDAKSLFDALRSRATSGTVCYARSSLAISPSPWDGVELLCPVLYETALRKFDRSVLEEVDVVCVASRSAVEAVGVVDLPYASIGPSTSAALRELGLEAWIEAPQPSFDALADSIARHVGDLPHQRA